ncbi:MAG: glycosyltransferase family 39 protein [Nitrospirae bacterium]|nr:glycosyltransferase family 39 protein [Nitrospirota bacterium]
MKLPEIDRVLSSARAEAAFVLAACVLAALYRGAGVMSVLLGGIPPISHISYDGVYYAQIARNILAGDGLGWEAMIFPALQPVFIAAIAYVTGIDNLAFLSGYVSQVAGIALLVPVYLLVRDLLGKSAAVAAVFVIIPYPHLVAISSADTVESLYAFFVFLSIYLGYRALSGAPPVWLAFTGISLGLTYLARPEGLIVFAGFLPIAAWRLYEAGGRGLALRGLGIIAAAFFVVSLPYMVFLTKSYKRVVLSPKLPYESVVMKSKVFGEDMSFRDVEGLTAKGEIVWREKGGAGLVLGYFRENPARFVRSYLGNLVSELPWNVGNSSHLEGYPIVYPVYIWLLAMAGFAFLVLPPGRRWAALLLLAPFANLFVYPVFTKGFWIYHAPYVPALVTFAAGGVLLLSRETERLTGRAVPLLLVLVLTWGGYSAYIRYSCSPQQVEAVNFKSVISEESKKVGRWARVNIGTDVTYMTTWSRLVYYLGGRWVSIPMDDHKRVVSYGIKNHADYIVEELVGDAAIAGPEYTDVPSLEHYFTYQSPDAPYAVVFWKIKNR